MTRGVAVLLGWAVAVAIAVRLTVDAESLDDTESLDEVVESGTVAAAVGVDECLEVLSAVGWVVGSGSAVGDGLGSAVGVAVADAVAVAVAVAVEVGFALGVAAVDVPVEALVRGRSTTPGAILVDVEVIRRLPVVVEVVEGSVVDCVEVLPVDVDVDAVPVEPVDVGSEVDELDEPDVESVVPSAAATP